MAFIGNVAWSVAVFHFLELEVRQKKGTLSQNTAFLVVEDPKRNIGSGSATLNALLCVAEYLAAKEGMTVRSLQVGGPIHSAHAFPTSHLD